MHLKHITKTLSVNIRDKKNTFYCIYLFGVKFTYTYNILVNSGWFIINVLSNFFSCWAKLFSIGRIFRPPEQKHSLNQTCTARAQKKCVTFNFNVLFIFDLTLDVTKWCIFWVIWELFLQYKTLPFKSLGSVHFFKKLPHQGCIY